MTKHPTMQLTSLSSIILVLSIGSILQTHGASNKPKIAIIGTGVGGSATAYYLSNYTNGEIQIDLFEKSNIVGGRTATVKVFGNDYETGGSVLHPKNKYATTLLSELDLERKVGGDTIGFSIVNQENDVVFSASKWSAISFFRMIYRYGFQFFRIQSMIDGFVDQFSKIYDLQKHCHFYQNPEELLLAMSPDLRNLTRGSLHDYLKYKGYSDRVINEIVQAITYVNYGQSTHMHSFVGSVALAGAGSSLWHVRGGNKHIAVALLNHTNTAKVHFSTEIGKVTKKDNKFLLHTAGYGEHPVEYDRVIIAAPLETSNIQLPYEVRIGKFHRTVSTVVAGHLREKYHALGDILTSSPSNPFTCLSRIFPTGLFVAEKYPVYKLFSPKPLVEPQLAEIFKKIEFIHLDDWMAYPEYDENEDKKIPPFKLGDGVYYNNAIEWTASAIEMSLIGAKNVALMVSQDLGSPCVPPKSKRSVDDKDEL